MGWRALTMWLCLGVAAFSLGVGLHSCGISIVPTAVPTATATRAATATPPRPPTPTVARAPTAPPPPTATPTLTAERAAACADVAAIYRRHGRLFDPTKDPVVVVAEVRALEGLDTPDARLSYGGKVIDDANNARILRCLGPAR